jgi:hypothetical protein
MTPERDLVQGTFRLFEIFPEIRPLFRGDIYAPVCKALLWTMKRGLGRIWTPQVAAAWASAYSTLANYMIGDAYGSCATAE